MRYRSNSILALGVCAAACWMCPTMYADMMVFWDFGDNGATYTEIPLIENIAGTPTLSMAGGDVDLNGKGGVGHVDSEGTVHPEGQAAAWGNVDPDSEMVITLDTTGWVDLSIRFDYSSENVIEDMGPTSFDLQYKIGEAGDWTKIEANWDMTRDSGWHEFVRDLSAIADIENNPVVKIRIDDIKAEDESGGYFKIDNIELTGTQMPTTVTVVHPNGDPSKPSDSEIIAGSDYRIEWSWWGPVSEVAIDYSLDDGNTWTEIAVVPNTGQFVWEVPDIDTSNGRIAVSNAGNTDIFDESDGPVRIYPCSVAFDLNGDCLVNLSDLALLASEWMVCGKPADLSCD